MKKLALMMLCAGVTACAEIGAQPTDNAVHPDAANYRYNNSPANDVVYELLGRLEQLQSEVQQLRGMVEEQGHTIADLERKQNNMYSDLDERMQVLTGAGTQVAAAPAAESEAAQPDSAPAAGAEAVPEDKPAGAEVSEQPAVSEQDRYQKAYETLRNGHNAQAIQMLEAFYADYPEGQFADNAQYWLGEAYKINRQPEKAQAAFNKVINQYPSSPKVPDALLKLGYIELDAQNFAKARDYFTRITAGFPTSTAAHLAAKKLAIMP